MPIAATTFFALGRQVTQGETIEADDPILTGRELLFDADEEATEAEPVKPPRSAKKAAPK